MALALLVGLALTALPLPRAAAWGRHGHALTTRVALGLLTGDLATFFRRNRFDLGYYSNVPDIVFRDRPGTAEDYEAPLHFFDLDNVLPPERIAELPLDSAQYGACFSGRPLPDRPDERLDVWRNGVVLWRVDQIYKVLRETMSTLRQMEATGDNPAALPRYQALLRRTVEVAGFLSHYVADSAQPFHAIADYDGWHRDQGDIHGYVESLVLDEQPADFEARALERARSRRAMRLEALHKLRHEPDAFPRDLEFALLLDSLHQAETLFDLDRRLALIAPSRRIEGERVAARRLAPADVAPQFGPVLLDRIATGAIVLAELYQRAWIEAGRPRLEQTKYTAFDPDPAYVPLTPNDLFPSGVTCRREP